MNKNNKNLDNIKEYINQYNKNNKNLDTIKEYINQYNQKTKTEKVLSVEDKLYKALSDNNLDLVYNILLKEVKNISEFNNISISFYNSLLNKILYTSNDSSLSNNIKLRHFSILNHLITIQDTVDNLSDIETFISNQSNPQKYNLLHRILISNTIRLKSTLLGSILRKDKRLDFINAKDKLGRTPLFISLENIENELGERENVLICRKLIEIQPKSAIISNNLNNLLLNKETSNKYLNKPLLLIIVDKLRTTTLSYIINWVIEIVILILNYNPTLDYILKQDDNGNTALMLSILYNNFELFEILLKKYKNPSSIRIKNNKGETALIIAIKNNAKKFAEKLLLLDPTKEHIELTDIEGKTAMNYNRDDFIEKLFYNISNNIYKTPLLPNYSSYISIKDSNLKEIIELTIKDNAKNNQIRNTIDLQMMFIRNLKKLTDTIDNNLDFNYTNLQINIYTIDKETVIFNNCLKILINLINNSTDLFRILLSNHTGFGGGQLKEFFYKIQEELKLIGYYKILCKKIKYKRSLNETNIDSITKLKDMEEEKKQILSDFSDIEEVIELLDNKIFWYIIHLSNFNNNNYTQYLPYNRYKNDTSIILDPYIFYAMKDLPKIFQIDDMIDEKINEDFNNILINFVFLLLINIFNCKKNENTQIFDKNDTLLDLLNIYSNRYYKLSNDTLNNNTKIYMKNTMQSLEDNCEHLFLSKDSRNFVISIINSDINTNEYIMEILKIIKYNINFDLILNDTSGIKKIIELINESKKELPNYTFTDEFSNALTSIFNENNEYIGKFIRLITGTSNSPLKIEVILDKLNPMKTRTQEIYFKEFSIQTCFNQIHLSIDFFYDIPIYDETSKNLLNKLYDLYSDTSTRNIQTVLDFLDNNFTKLSQDDLAKKITEKMLLPELNTYIHGGNNSKKKIIKKKNMNKVYNSNILINNLVLGLIVLVTSFLQR